MCRGQMLEALNELEKVTDAGGICRAWSCCAGRLATCPFRKRTQGWSCVHNWLSLAQSVMAVHVSFGRRSRCHLWRWPLALTWPCLVPERFRADTTVGCQLLSGMQSVWPGGRSGIGPAC